MMYQDRKLLLKSWLQAWNVQIKMKIRYVTSYQEYEVWNGDSSLKTLNYHDHIYFHNTETPEHVFSELPLRSSPRIAAFIGEEMIQNFVLVEQCVLSQVPSLQYALFITFSAYYIFHLEYS